MKNFKFNMIFGVLSCLWMLFYISCNEKDPIAVQGNIEGTVVDAETSQAVQGVNVSIVANSNTTFAEQSKMTGSDGKFSFKDLEAGSYKLSFSKDGYENNSKNINLSAGQTSSSDVTLTPIKSTLDVTPTLLDFGTVTNILPVEIRNTGKGELTWNIVEDVAWLSVNPNTGKTTNEVSTITVTIDRSLITEDSKTATFIINSNSGSRTVNVSVSKASSVLSVTPETLDFGTTETEKSINVSNAGAGTLSYAATTAQSWITLENGTNSLTTDTKIIKVTVNRAGLSPNSYSGNVVINSNSNSITVPVSMSVIQPSAPDLLNGQASGITYNSAQVSGTLTSLGSSAITQHGHCWSTSPNPTTTDNKTTLGGTTLLASFMSNITGLSTNTTYYVKAYATNAVGTTYSDAITFTTLPPPTVATVQTTRTENIKHNQIDGVGNITVLGDGLVTDYGFCYSTSNATPTISDSKASLGQTTQLGNFTVTVTGLKASTKYYLRAYAVNSMGTAYGGVVEATTTDAPPVVTSGLVAYYTFDNENCNEAQGKSEYNGAEQGSGNRVWSSDIPGNSGKSLQVDKGIYFRVSPSPFNLSPSNYTISVWVKTMSNQQYLFKHEYQWGGSDGTSINPIIAIQENNYIYTQMNNNACCSENYSKLETSIIFDTSAKLLDGNWHLLTISRKAGYCKLYIDGVYCASEQGSSTLYVNTPLLLGSNFTGKMDNFRIYNRELTQAEITEIYNAKQ
jgi:hypothetical protein